MIFKSKETQKEIDSYEGLYQYLENLITGHPVTGWNFKYMLTLESRRFPELGEVSCSTRTIIVLICVPPVS